MHLQVDVRPKTYLHNSWDPSDYSPYNMLHHILHHIDHSPFLVLIEASLPRNLVLSMTLPDHALCKFDPAPHSLAWNMAYPCNTDVALSIGGSIGRIHIGTYSHVDGTDIVVGSNHSRDIDHLDLHTNVLVLVVPK